MIAINITIDDSANVTITGNSTGDHFGNSISDAFDFNGDGYYDILIGSPYFGADDSGAAYLFYGSGSVSGIITTSDADFNWTGENSGDHFGFSVSFAGNIDNDNNGFSETIIGSISYDLPTKPEAVSHPAETCRNIFVEHEVVYEALQIQLP